MEADKVFTPKEVYMRRAIELAHMGTGNCAPNPIVGAVIVHNNRVIGEGYHRKYGEAHAEVNAVAMAKRDFPSLLKESTIYVTLEPCSHYGKTPPCSKLIIDNNIPRVVIGVIDPFAKVAGRGVKMLQDAGIEVISNFMEADCLDINREFFTFHKERRPYIILKWAESQDGFIDKKRDSSEYGDSTPISNSLAKIDVHKSRSIYSAIAVGTNTAIADNPSLTIRDWDITEHPTRVIIDRTDRLPLSLNIFDGSVPTLIYTQQLPIDRKEIENVEYIEIDFNINIAPQITESLHSKGITSLYVEGGTKFINSFLDSDLWDEIDQYIGNSTLKDGTRAPKVRGVIVGRERLNDTQYIKYAKDRY